MKKILFLPLFLIFSVATHAYATDVWVTAGYSYLLPTEKGSSAPYGPIDFKVGVQAVDWVAFDFAIGYYWKFKNPISDNRLDTTLDGLPVRADILLQKKLYFAYFTLLPYIGIGPAFYANGSNFANNEFSFGFSAKAGVRFADKGYIFGVGIEYLYNKVKISSGGNTYNYDASGVMFGGEVGFYF